MTQRSMSIGPFVDIARYDDAVYPPIAVSNAVEGDLLVGKAGDVDFELASLSAIGGLSGPAAPTDHAIPRYDSAAPTVLQDSGVLIDDSNNLYAINRIYVGGGYGSTGATLYSTGVGSFNGALTTDGPLTADSVVTAGNIGIAADPDLLQLAANLLTVNGTTPGVVVAGTSTYSYLQLANDGGATKAGLIATTNAGLTQIRSETTVFTNYDASVEYARVASGGNFGIGITPATRLDIDSNSNTQCLRIRGADAANEIADFFVDSFGNLVISTIPGNDTAQFIDLRTEDASNGVVIRQSSGAGIVPYANLYVTDAADDLLSITVNSGAAYDFLNICASTRIGIGLGDPVNAKLCVDQSSTTAATAVLELDQGDTDQRFIDFVGATSATYGTSISTLDGDGAVEGPSAQGADDGWSYESMLMIKVNTGAGLVERWIALYSQDPV